MDLAECATVLTPERSRHFWELARADFLCAKLRRELDSEESGVLMDFGCGDGYLLRRMAKILPQWRFIAVDPALKASARSVLLDALPGRLECLAALPEDCSQVRAVTLFDVLEHLQDDAGMLKKLREKLVPGTLLIATVPADQKLFGPHDEVLHHFRRYSKKALEKVFLESGFEILDSREFFSLLWFGRKMERLLHRPPVTRVGSGALRPRVLNSMLRHLLHGMACLESRMHVRGLSVGALCRVPF